MQKIDRGKLAEVHYAKALREYDAGQTEEALKEVKSALRLRPSYLEAIRLKERIIAEKDGRQALDQLERKMSESMDHCEAPSWLRR